MAKRAADVQMRADGMSFVGDGSEGMTPDQLPQRASTSAMARRKVARARGHRANSPSSGAPLALPASAFQIPGANSNPASNFAPPNLNFSFGSSAPQNNDSNGNQQPSSTSAFQFGGSNAGTVSGFSGSTPAFKFNSNIFDFGGTSARTSSDTPDTSSQSQSQPPSTPSFGGFNAFNANSTQAQSSNIFGNPQSSTSASNIFGNAQTPSSTSNIFGNLHNLAPTSTSNIFGNLQSSAPSSNIFGNMSPQKSQTDPFFGQTQNTGHQTPQLFGQAEPSLDQDTTMGQSSGAQSSPPKASFQFGPSSAVTSNPSATFQSASGPFGRPQNSDQNNAAAPTDQHQSVFPNLFGSSAATSSNIFQDTVAGQPSGSISNIFGGLQSSTSTGLSDKPADSKPEGNAKNAPFGSLSRPLTGVSSQPKPFQWGQPAANATPEISSVGGSVPGCLSFSVQPSSTPSAPQAPEPSVDTTQPETPTSSDLGKSLFDRISAPALDMNAELSTLSSIVPAPATQTQAEASQMSNSGKSLFERISAPETQTGSATATAFSTPFTPQAKSAETAQSQSDGCKPPFNSFPATSEPPTSGSTKLYASNPALKPTWSLRKKSSAPTTSEPTTSSSSLTGLSAANEPSRSSQILEPSEATVKPSNLSEQVQEPKTNGASIHVTGQKQTTSSLSSSIASPNLPSDYIRRWDEIRSGELPLQKAVDILLNNWILTIQPPTKALEMVKAAQRPLLTWKWRQRAIQQEWKKFVDTYGESDRNLMETFRTVEALCTALTRHSNLNSPPDRRFIEDKYLDEVQIKKKVKENQAKWAQKIENARKRRSENEETVAYPQKKQRTAESSLAQVVSDSDGTKKRRFDEQEQENSTPKRSRNDVEYPSLPENSSKTSQMFASVASAAKPSGPAAEEPKDSAPAFSVPQFGSSATATAKSTAAAFKVPQFGSSTKETATSTTPTFKPPQFGTSSGVDFMAQFGKAAQATAEQEKQKKMDDNYDSEEETKEQWSERYDREQAAKKAELEKVSKAQTSQFQFKRAGAKDGSKDTVTSADNAIFARVSSAPASASETTPVSTSPLGDNTWKPDSPIKFGLLSEQPKFSFTAPTPVKPNETPERSLFVDDSSEKPSARNLFSFDNAPSTTPKTAPPSLFKLGASSTDTPTKASSSIFTQGASGNVPASGTASPSVFSTGTSTSTPRPKFDFNKSEPTSTPSPPPSDGWKDFLKTSQSGQNLFAIPKPSSGSPAPSVFASLTPSRGVSPALTSATASGAETDNNEDTEEAQDEQLDLGKANAGEEGEDMVFSVKARIQEMAADTEEAKKSWKLRGIGELRMLKNKESGKTRVLVRQETSAKVLLNAGLLSGVSYSLAGPKYVNFTVAASDGGLNRWLIQVGKEDKAKELSELLEESKKG